MNKKITLFLMTAFLALNLVGQTDTLYVNLTSHYANAYRLDGVRKLTFTETELNLVAPNGSIKTVAFSNIENLTFARKYDDRHGGDSGDSVGITKIDSKTIQVFPNPVTDLLTVESETPISEITVFDLHGRVVLHDMTHRQGAIVSFKSNPAGVYFIQITTEREKIVKKIIKY
jgi:hypothetical protein